MAVTVLGVPVYIITGLLLISRISFLSQVYAMPNLDLSVHQRHDNLSKDGIALHPESALETKDTKQFGGNSIGKQIAESLLGASVDKVTNMMTATSNFLNARTQITDVDRYLTTFSDFFSSDGINAINSYYTVFSNAWVVIDAVAMFVRFIEAREKQRKRDKEAEVELEETAILAGEVVDILEVTNERLDDFRRSMQILICRRAANVKRSGDDRFRRAAQDRQIDCSSLLRRIDENKKRRNNTFKKKILEQKVEELEGKNNKEDEMEENNQVSINESQDQLNVIRKRVLPVGLTSQPYSSVAWSNANNDVLTYVSEDV